MAKFIMKVDDFVCLGLKTIFSGITETAEKHIVNTSCTLLIDGKPCGKIIIAGEASVKVIKGVDERFRRDLWTISPVSLDRSDLVSKEIMLVADN